MASQLEGVQLASARQKVRPVSRGSALENKLLSKAKEWSFRIFSALDLLDVHLLPKHYYTPVADYTWLRRHRELWTGRLGLGGIQWDLDAQLIWLAEICKPYYREVRGLDFFNKAVAGAWGHGYGPIESQVLHCVIRSLAPRKIIEIGSGVSTACMLNASTLNTREGRGTTEMICIEPYPKPAFNRLTSEFKNVRHIEAQCQAVPQTLFDDLEAGDLLFIDSSHAVKTGSDVVKIYLDFLPRLRPGVLVHVHDIYLPYAYQRDALSSYFGWQETALLAALLTGNRNLSISACLSGLHYDRKAQLQTILTDYFPQTDSDGLQAGTQGHFPSSLWLLTQGT